PRGNKKFRAYPRATLTTSPRRPTLSMSLRRMTSIQWPSATFGDVRQQGHLACALDCDRDLTLVPSARAGDPAGADLAPLGDVPAQLVDVLVVDLVDLVLTEEAGLPPDRAGLARALAPRLPVPVSFSSARRQARTGARRRRRPHRGCRGTGPCPR